MTTPSPVNYKLGHRSRVKERFLREGVDTFADYEILEFLLFYAIPRRDTKDMAHALMHSFSTLYGVLSASEEDLCRINGIGPRVAKFLRSLLPFAEYVLKEETRPISFEKPDKLGSFFLQFFRENPSVSSVALFLSNNKQPIRLVKYPDVKEFSELLSAARTLTAEAYSVNAPLVVLANRKSSGIPLPTFMETELFRDLERELSGAGIALYESVLVVGSQYMLCLNHLNGTLCHANASDRSYIEDPSYFSGARPLPKERLREFLSLTQNREQAELECENILSVYPTLRTVSSVPYETLTKKDLISSSAAMLLSLTLGTYARAMLSKALASEKPYNTLGEVGRLFSDVLGSRDKETMALAFFDEERHLLDMKFFGTGTVNTAVFAYRTMLEETFRRHAKYVALAHNHPLGDSTPSTQDLSITVETQRLFSPTNIKFIDHFVVTERDFHPIAATSAGQNAENMTFLK